MINPKNPENARIFQTAKWIDRHPPKTHKRESGRSQDLELHSLAYFRIGDNDNDPEGEFEYILYLARNEAIVGGGQICWGTADSTGKMTAAIDINFQVLRTPATLPPLESVSLCADTGNPISGVVSLAPEIVDATVEVDVATDEQENTDYGVAVDHITYNGIDVEGSVAKGIQIIMNERPLTPPDSMHIYRFTSSADVDITAKIHMVSNVTPPSPFGISVIFKLYTEAE